MIFSRCLDGLQIILSATVTAANLLELKLSDIKAEENSLEQAISSITAMLDEMIEAQTQRDIILLADLIEYEMIPTLEDWKMFMALMVASSKDA